MTRRSAKPPGWSRRRWRRRAGAALACGLLAAGGQAANSNLAGWREAVVSVSDLSGHLRFFTKTAGWRVLHRSRLSPAQLRHWQLGPGVSGEQALVGNPGTERGYVRLLQFRGGEQRAVRAHAQSWDTGGFFDLNMRVRRMDEQFQLLPGMGWHAVTEPARFHFGPFQVEEWIVNGPDGLTLALIERLAPPLTGWPKLRKISRAFNATQIVADLAASMDFYRDTLGFDVYLHHEGASEPPGTNVLGLPLNLAMKAQREIYILHPQKINDGSVELLSYHGSVTGHDFADRAVPPNLGILMLRFPVRDMAALVRRLKRHGVETLAGPRRIALPPYGRTKLLTVRAPAGGWLEFFEVPKPGPAAKTKRR